MHLTALVFPILVVVFVLLILGTAYFHRQSQADLRHAVLKEPTICTVPVVMRKVLAGGGWGKTYNGMRLIVREKSVHVTGFFPFIGALLSTDWIFKAADLTMEVSQSPSGAHKREWIVFYGVETDTPVMLAISANSGNSKVWNSLVQAGVQPVSNSVRPGS
jgi:nitrate/nitrite transporter NarK